MANILKPPCDSGVIHRLVSRGSRNAIELARADGTGNHNILVPSEHLGQKDA